MGSLVEVIQDKIEIALIRAHHRPFFTWFFRIYSEQMIRRYFRKVKLNGEFHDKGLPVLLIGNHFSWWDGFIANIINTRVLQRKFHIMMLEDQLRHRMFLNKAGAYSIRKGSRSAIESFQYTAGLLKDAGNLVVLYPQGEFESIHRRRVTFQRGIEMIFPEIQGNIHLVFYAALVDYFSTRKPGLTVYVWEFPVPPVLDVSILESAYNRFLADCAKQQTPD
jgi:hypothetical protein